MSSVVVSVSLPSADELANLDGPDLDRALWQLEQVRRRVEAAIVDVVDRCEGTLHHLADGHRSVRGWTMATTNCSPGEALRRQQAAHALRQLPSIATDLRAGRIGVAQVHELGRLAANPRSRDQLSGSEQVLGDAARQLEFVDFRTVTRRWEALADADGAHRSHEARHERRDARLVETDGEFSWETRHGVIDGAAMREVFQAFCEAEFRADWEATKERHGAGAAAHLMPRTAAQRRADAMVAMIVAAASAGIHGRSIDVDVNLVVDLDQFQQYTREQIDDTPVVIDPATVRDRRCETLDGIAVDPREAVALAFLGRVRRVVVNSAGIVVDAGRWRRLFDGALREAVMAIDPRCRWLGCTLRAAIAQIDHIQPHSEGGATDAGNGWIMCDRHNIHKHVHRYTPQRQPDGSWLLLRPDGTPMQPPDAA